MPDVTYTLEFIDERPIIELSAPGPVSYVGGEGGGGPVQWTQILGKPQSFVPTAHTHPISDVTDLQNQLNLKSNVNHSHDTRYLRSVNGVGPDAAGNVDVAAGGSGTPGPTGPQGPQGVAGPTGPKGDKGDTGSTGAQGIQGVKGDTGSQGPIGLTGAKGDKGDTGATGSASTVAGPQGVKGDTGAQGPIGLTGAKGDTGAQGPQGEVGPQGPAGSGGSSDISGAAYQSAVLADNPVIYSRLGGVGNQENIGSQAGVLAPGTGVSFLSASKTQLGFKDSLLFDGSTAALVSATLVNTRMSGSFSVECWYKTTASDKTLVQYFAAPYWYMNIDATGKLSFTSNAATVTASTATNNGQWHHAVAVVQRGTSTRLYVDSALVGTSAGDPGTFSNSTSMTLGDSRSAYAYQGNLDEVAFYTSALTAARITAHYNVGVA